MTDRASLLRRFGEVEDWLAEHVHSMTPEGWRIFYDYIEGGGRLPKTLEDTMPRNFDDLLCNPHSAPDQHREAELAKWAAWTKIWGPAPWDKPQTYKPSMRRWRD